MVIHKITQLFFIIILCLLESIINCQLINQNSKWNISGEDIFKDLNITTTNDVYLFNLSNSDLQINRDTESIAILDDNNNRIIIFNRSNLSTLFEIVPDPNNSLQSIIYYNNNSIYITDGWNKQIVKINNPLDYGENQTFILNWNFSSLFNFTPSGLCVDNDDIIIYISDYDHHQIIQYDQTTSNVTIYIGNGTSGNTSYQLNQPKSIVINDNKTLFINDFGNNRIQMFKYNSAHGITLPINITGCIGLSLYSSNILVINTNNSIYLFSLINNITNCIIGCNYSVSGNIHNAIIDNQRNLIVTKSNLIVQYSFYEEYISNPSVFHPQDNCPNNETFGTSCSTSKNICDFTRPCLNDGTCIENKTNQYGYTCYCVWDVYGIDCEDDKRPCKPYTCFGRGICINTSDTDYECICDQGYEGKQCELKVNLCVNVTCQNGGVCFNGYLDYSCICLSGYYGRYCEKSDSSIVAHIYVSKSLGYIAIIFISILIGFFIFMDMLKYVFGIDPVKFKRKRLRRKFLKKKKIKVAYRFKYIN